MTGPPALPRQARPQDNPPPFPADIEVVCFDLDDTLIVASAAWRLAFIEAIAVAVEDPEALRRLGDLGALHDSVYRPLIMEEHHRGDGDWDSAFVDAAFRRLLTDRGIASPAVIRRSVEAYHEAWPRLTRLYADTLPTLDTLAGRYRLALVTDGASREQRLKIETHGLAHRFEVIAVSREVGARKPDPAIFHHVLTALDVTAGRAVHIGDRPERDVAGAHAAGLGGIWLNRDGVAAGADDPQPHAEIASLSELPPLLTQLRWGPGGRTRGPGAS